MKYIRTKDGKVYEENKLYFEPLIEEYISIKNPHTRVGEIDFEADTIEELCDEFIAMPKQLAEGHIPITFEGAQKFAKNGMVVYGAIWTDKGLIYVAKMNEKGELELL